MKTREGLVEAAKASFSAHSWGLEEEEGGWGGLKGNRRRLYWEALAGRLLDKQDERQETHRAEWQRRAEAGLGSRGGQGSQGAWNANTSPP